MISMELPARCPSRFVHLVLRYWSSLLILVGALGAADGYFFHEAIAREWDDLWWVPLPRSKTVPEGEGTYNMMHSHPAPPAVTPRTTPAAEAKLLDSEEVLAVSAGGKHRAYRLATLAGDLDHVVDDVVGDVAVTVTYCDLADCARAFTKTGRPRPLPISQVGFRDHRFVIETGGVGYFQDTGEAVDPTVSSALPFSGHPLERMTWKEWKMRHPDTDIYTDVVR